MYMTAVHIGEEREKIPPFWNLSSSLPTVSSHEQNSSFLRFLLKILFSLESEEKKIFCLVPNESEIDFKNDYLKKNARLLKGVGGKGKYDKTQATLSDNAVEAMEINQ